MSVIITRGPMENTTSTILHAIENLRKEVRDDLSEHKQDDTRQFTSLSEKVQALRDDNNKFKGAMHTLLILQGIVTFGMAVVELIHLVKH